MLPATAMARAPIAGRAFSDAPLVGDALAVVVVLLADAVGDIVAVPLVGIDVVIDEDIVDMLVLDIVVMVVGVVVDIMLLIIVLVEAMVDVMLLVTAPPTIWKGCENWKSAVSASRLIMRP